MSEMERLIQRFLFASRWLLLPLYFGLAAYLVVIAIEFFREFGAVADFRNLDATHTIVVALSLIDFVLLAGLIIIVILIGYENFISRLDAVAGERQITWLGTFHEGSLKYKVVVAIVTISAIHLLSAFMDAKEIPNDKLFLLVVIHLSLVVTSISLALIDRMTGGKGD
jgi:uncharacterized protein (TIGR00645 family)